MMMINRVNEMRASVVVPDIDAEDLVGSEWAEWYRMTATERTRSSASMSGTTTLGLFTQLIIVMTN